MPRAITADGTLHPRNTPTIFNVGLNAAYNWDGIANTLEAHAEIVLLHPGLMSMTWPELLTKLQADADYVTRFNTAYAGGLTPANVLDALACFERSLLTPNARFDRYLWGELQALTAPEEIGLIVQFLHTLTGEYHGRPVATSGQEHSDGYE